MGFFKNIFKKKKGGTFFGNLLRAGSSAVTGGILGSGAGLRKWEAEQAQKEQDAYYKSLAEKGSNIGQTLGDSVKNNMGNEEEEKGFLAILKKYWYWFAAGLVALIVLLWFAFGKRKNKFNFKRS